MHKKMPSHSCAVLLNNNIQHVQQQDAKRNAMYMDRKTSLICNIPIEKLYALSHFIFISINLPKFEDDRQPGPLLICAKQMFLLPQTLLQLRSAFSETWPASLFNT